MIAVRLMGGLGNQLFQYAAGRALALRLDTELVLDIRNFKQYKLHEYGLERFNIKARIATSKELRRWPFLYLRFYRFARALGVRGGIYKEARFDFDPSWIDISDGALIEGYFQSEKYFEEIADLLHKELTPVAPLVSRNAQYAAWAQACESVMIHVRRGDYISNPKALEVHGVCSVDYYKDAIKFIRENIKSPKFFVFSNEIQWAKDNLGLGNDTVYVEGNEKSAEIDIYLMSQCRHHIVANSTFSWWGAWLKANKTGLTIAPAPWFDTNKLPTSDLLPSNWIMLPK